jgi:hypothetical protein
MTDNNSLRKIIAKAIRVDNATNKIFLCQKVDQAYKNEETSILEGWAEAAEAGKISSEYDDIKNYKPIS